MDEDLLDRAFQRKYFPHWLFAGGVVLVVISAFIWWTQVYENAYNVYWSMLANSLSTSSDMKHLVDNTNGTRLDEYIGQQFGPNTIAYGKVTITNPTNVVQTESVGTLSTDYIRYTSIQTKQKNKSGNNYSFSKVLGKWAKSPVQNVAATGSTSTPLFAQTVLGLGGGNLIPIANLTLSQRQFLVRQLHENDIFDTTFNNVQKSAVNGRPAYVYTVSVEPVAYVAFEKQFANDLGLHTLDNIDPNSYQNQQSIQVELSVDIRSHHLVEINYPGSQHQEFYSSYGVPLNMQVPHATISSQTLQNLISQTQ